MQKPELLGGLPHERAHSLLKRPAPNFPDISKEAFSSEK
jgi:hypothetical protein